MQGSHSKKNTAQITFLSISIILASSAFAGTMGPVCVPGNVTVPCPSNAWDLGAQALYLNPTIAGDLTYLDGYQGTQGFDVYNNRGNQWRWGFQIEGSYHYGTGNDIDATWYHLNATVHNNFNSSIFDTTFINAQLGAPPTYLQTATNQLSTSPTWDQVNVEFGQHVDFSDTSKARFHAGVEYARVKINSVNNAHWYDGGFVGIVYQQEQIRSTFNGFGPRGGLDLMYAFKNGVQIYGKSTVSLLIGHSGWTGSVVANHNASRHNFTTECYNGTAKRLVPEMEAKLGANYTWTMAYGDVTFDIGYMWLNYFNVLDGIHETNNVSADVANTRSDKRGLNDFGLDGLYLGLKWLGNFA
jgi:hypothetical protein